MAYTGLHGIQIGYQNRNPRRPLAGLAGLIVELEGNLPIRVVNQRGQGLSGVYVTILNPNTVSPSSGYTDSEGNVSLQADSTDPNTITFSKNKAFGTVSYTLEATLTIVLDPPLI